MAITIVKSQVMVHAPCGATGPRPLPSRCGNAARRETRPWWRLPHLIGQTALRELWAYFLHLEDRPDGVVDLLKLLGGCAAQVLDEAATGWTIDLQSERPAELPDLHG